MKKIQILGTGCAKCNELAANAKQAAAVLGEDVEIEKVTDIKEFANYGCMTTPGLVINGSLVSQGKLLKPDQIMRLIGAIQSGRSGATLCACPAKISGPCALWPYFDGLRRAVTPGSSTFLTSAKTACHYVS